jgi:hypothetical protein
MFSVFRPSFEVVKEGRILKKIKYLQTQIVGVFYLVERTIAAVWLLH